MSVSLTGNDVMIFTSGAGTRVITDLATDDTVLLEFPNNLVEGTTGKNGNTIFAYNSTGEQVTATLRVLRGSSDDKFLNSQQVLFKQDPAAYVLLSAEFIKRVGDGLGNVNDDIYTMSGGIPQVIPGTKENVAGDTEQSVTIWKILFANGKRNIA